MGVLTLAVASMLSVSLSIWPVRGPVVAPFTATGPYAAGHRGIDIAAPPGTPVRAVAAGTVTFAGNVAGNRSVTVASAGGVEEHYSFLASISVASGDVVAVGDVLGTTGPGHPGVPDSANLHFGLEVDGAYVDPLPLLPRRHVRLVA